MPGTRADGAQHGRDLGLAINASAVLESTTDCVIVFDPAWRFVYLNERAKALLAPGRDLLGTIVWQEFPQQPGAIFEAACRRVMAERFPLRCEDFSAPLGIWFENSIYPCGDGVAVYFRDITEQKRQQQALRDSEEQSRQQLAELEAIYAAAPIGLAVLTPDLHFLRVNEQLAEINGCSVAAHMGRSVRDVVPQLADALEAAARQVVATGVPVRDFEIEGETPARPNERRTWIAQWLPQKDPVGTIVSINVVVEDVTDRRNIGRELRDKVEELQAVFDAVPAAVWLARDPACQEIVSNRAGLEILRAPPGANVSKSAGNEAAARHFEVHKDGVEIPPHELPIQQAAATGMEIRGFEESLVFDDGDVRHIYGNASPLFDATGVPRGAVGAFIDITEIVAAREANRERHQELERLVAERTADRDRFWMLSSDLMLTARFDGTLEAVNPAWTDVLGWTEAELVGRHRLDFIHPDDQPRTTDSAMALSQGAPIRRLDNRWRHKDGSYRTISWTAAGGDGVIHSVGRDITIELERTKALELSAARMRSVFETTYLYQGLLTTDGILLEANPASLAGIDARPEDVLGRPFWETPWFTGTPGMPEQVKAAVALVATGQPVRQEIIVDLPTGRREFDFAMRPVFDDAGKVVAIVPEAMEVTERREAEEQLRQVQKMEAVGQLSGGIAHDFNNLLTGITGSLELLASRLAQGRIGELDRYIEVAQGAAKRAAVLTHRLLAFSRRQSLDPQPTNANRLVADMEDLIRRSVGPQITVETHAAEGLWSALVDQNQLENALLNLCVNARDAMPGGGRLTIETDNRRLDDREYVVLSVRDTGIGMPPEVLARAFDPFFTTKPVGEGTGLGLSMVYGFARQSGGRALIESEPGVGTTVRLLVPRHLGAEANVEPASGAAECLRAAPGETVLIVDDDLVVRQNIVEALEDLGYVAIAVLDAAAALQVLGSDRRIDLMITDVGLPGLMNGHQLAAAGRVTRPELKVVFVTGYGDSAIMDTDLQRPGTAALSKPFAMEALTSAVKNIIAGR